MFCFASKSAWVIVEPVEFAIFVSISTPSINNVLQFICPGTTEPLEEVSLETIKELIFKCEFIAATNPDVLAKDKSPSFIKSCFVSKSACVIPPPLEEIVSFIIVILEPAIKIFCFNSSVSLTFKVSPVVWSSIVKILALSSPDKAGTQFAF